MVQQGRHELHVVDDAVLEFLEHGALLFVQGSLADLADLSANIGAILPRLPQP